MFCAFASLTAACRLCEVQNTLDKKGRLRLSLFCCEAGLGQSVRHFAGAVYVHQIRKRLFAVQAEFFKACVEAQRHRQQALQARLGAVRPTGRALAEKRVFVRQLCRQSFPLRANGFSRSVRRQYALTFFRLFAPVRLLLLQYLFFVLSAPFVCFRQLRQRLFPFGRTFFCVRMPSVLTFFRPSAFRQTVAFAHVRFSFCYFAVVLCASRCR